MYDAQWSPVHPSVFASVDAEGYIDVWNINRDIDLPLVRQQVAEKPKPINTLRWSKDGRRIVTGDSAGNVTLHQVDNDLVVPKQEDFDKMMRFLHNAP